jgi:hypothetical protein
VNMQVTFHMTILEWPRYTQMTPVQNLRNS